MSNSYGRVNYTKTDGSASSAYLSPDGNTAYDVYSNMPVNLSGDDTGGYREWQPPKQVKSKPQEQPRATRVVPTVRVWQIPVIAAFGLAMIWLETQFPGMLTPK